VGACGRFAAKAVREVTTGQARVRGVGPHRAQQWFSSGDHVLPLHQGPVTAICMEDSTAYCGKPHARQVSHSDHSHAPGDLYVTACKRQCSSE
jgi:hypothetical protein